MHLQRNFKSTSPWFEKYSAEAELKNYAGTTLITQKGCPDRIQGEVGSVFLSKLQLPSMILLSLAKHDTVHNTQFFFSTHRSNCLHQGDLNLNYTYKILLKCVASNTT